MLLFAYLLTLTQNTNEHLNFALEVWQNCVKEHQLTQSINFLSMLAINQSQPKIALDILSTNDKHFSSLNIRLLALHACGHLSEIIEIVKRVSDDERYKNVRLSNNVVSPTIKCMHL